MASSNRGAMIRRIRNDEWSVETAISASVNPTLNPLTDAQTPSQGLSAGALTLANYSSTAGAIVSVTPEYRVNGNVVAGSFDLVRGQNVTVLITVVDDAGNVRIYRPQARIVTYATGPVFSSGLTAVSVVETQAVPYVVSVYGASQGAILSMVGGDVSKFSFNASTGVLTRTAGLDYETDAADTVTIRATNADGLYTDRALVYSITDSTADGVDTTAPTILSGPTAFSILENTGADQLIGTYTADEPVYWSITGEDVTAFRMMGTGALYLVPNPDYETKSSYAVTVVGRDRDNTLTGTRNVVVTITNDAADDPVIDPPVFTSGATAFTILENSGAGQTISTYAVDEASTWSLTGADAASFAISSGGVLTLIPDPNYETKTSYVVNVVATRISNGAAASRTMTVTVTNVNEAPNLNNLTLSADSVAEGTAPGVQIGSLVGRTAGSQRTLTNSAGNRFAFSDPWILTGATATDYETNQSHQITIRETLADSANSPKDTTLTINVTDVAEAISIDSIYLGHYGYYYDAWDPDIRYQDNAATTLAPNTGDPVGRILAKNSSLYATQGTSGNKPTVVAVSGYGQAMRWDSTDVLTTSLDQAMNGTFFCCGTKGSWFEDFSRGIGNQNIGGGNGIVDGSSLLAGMIAACGDIVGWGYINKSMSQAEKDAIVARYEAYGAKSEFSFGAEEITNGTGAATTGWSTSNSSLSIVSGQLRVTGTHASSSASAYQSFTKTAGDAYLVEATATKRNTNFANARVGIFDSPPVSSGIIAPSMSTSVDVPVSVKYIFIVPADGVFGLTCYCSSVTAIGAIGDFDNVSMKKLSAT